MKNFNWKDALKHHPLFWALDDKEIEQLLKDEVSLEGKYSEGSVILREGEFGDSVFVIGFGSVQVVVEGGDGDRTVVSILKRGDFFGEMAVLDQKPRAATVMANENCILLEIKGPEFLQLLAKHPDIESKILLKLSERLRHVEDQVLGRKIKDVGDRLNVFNAKLDDRLNAFNAKLEAELRVIDASLRAAHTVFDQTKVRTDEVINSAERSRSRLTAAASTAGTIIAAVVAVFGWFGVNEIKSVHSIAETAKAQVEAAKTQVADAEKQVEATKMQVADAEKQLTDFQKTVAHVQAEADAANKTLTTAKESIAQNLVIPGILQKLNDKNPAEAQGLFETLLELDKDRGIEQIPYFLSRIEAQIEKGEAWGYTPFLESIRDVAKPEDKITTNDLLWRDTVLLLKDIILKKGEEFFFIAALEDLESYLKDNKDQRESVEAKLEKLFDAAQTADFDEDQKNRLNQLRSVTKID